LLNNAVPLPLRRLKKLITLILLLAFSGQTFTQGWYWLDYQLSRASYEQKCINKARPKLQCHGKCQLMKKIQEEEKRQQQNAPEMKHAEKAETLGPTILSFQLDTISTALAAYSYPENSGSPIDQPVCIFHPPAHTQFV
jgi:hypothetical protein